MFLAATVLGCGDDVRATASAGQTDGTTAPLTTGATAVPTTGDATTAAPTSTDEGSASNSNSQGESTTPTPTTTAASVTGTTTTGDVTTGEPETTTGNTTEPVDPCAGEMGAFDFSYLWVANTSQGSVSKINTTTMIEEGRYYAHPDPANASTSRTSVNIDGHYVVVTNRQGYSATKIAANIDDCVDTNMDGMITTSQN